MILLCTFVFFFLVQFIISCIMLRLCVQLQNDEWVVMKKRLFEWWFWSVISEYKKSNWNFTDVLEVCRAAGGDVHQDNKETKQLMGVPQKRILDQLVVNLKSQILEELSIDEWVVEVELRGHNLSERQSRWPFCLRTSSNFTHCSETRMNKSTFQSDQW